MASKAANLIGQQMSAYLNRPLTSVEVVKCEELNLNYYTNATMGYIKGLIKKDAPKNFDLVYVAIMNGVLRGALRRHDLIYLRGRMLEVYNKITAFIGDGMSEKELSDVIFMADDCTNKEIDAAIQAARIRGGHHVGYVRAVIDGNRRAASRSRVLSNKKKFIPDEYAKYISGVPRVDIIRELWKERVQRAEEKIEINRAELNAKKKSRGY